MTRRRALRAATILTLAAGGLTPVVVTAATGPAAAATASGTSYTPGSPQLATITNGTSAAPWNEWQGDPASAAYSSQSPGSVLPTYTPGGTTLGGSPNLSVYPSAASGSTDGSSPYPSGVVGSPGPLDGYCGTGGNTAESAGSPTRQPAGTTLPLAPAYFPHIVRNADGTLTGFFDYRPKDADEAIVTATSDDNGRDWIYQGEALEQNPGYCPTGDINDDGEGHPNVLTVGGVSRLYTLQRAAGDNMGVGMLVHTLSTSETDPLAGVPATEKVGIDPDAFATSAVTVPANGGTPVAVALSQTGTAGTPEQLVSGEFVDLTATPVPTATSVLNCTVGAAGLTGCTAAGGTAVNVSSGDLIEQVIGTANTGSPTTTVTIPAGPNKTTGDGGLASLSVNFATQTTAAIFNNNAPNRAYVDGVAVYCSQANANPTTKIEDCSTGPGGAPLTVANGDPVTSDPIIPATAQQTTGLIAPDGIVGVLPSYPGAPAGATVIAYTEKILSYYVAGITTNSKSATFSSSIAFTPSASTAQDLPSPGSITTTNPVTVSMGDSTKAAIIPVTCTGLTIGTSTDTLTGCSVPSGDTTDSYSSTSEIGAPGAATVPAATLALTGEGSTSTAKLFKNNEDLTVLRVAYTFNGTTFLTSGLADGTPTPGLANGGIISGASNGASNYSDINNPSSTVSPSNLNAYATPGTADATEMRFVGSAGSIITNPDGSYGMFLSGAWAGDGDSDSFNQIFYSSSSDGEHWSVPVSVVSTDYTFSASVAQDTALYNGQDVPIGISAYYSGRAYGPSVVQNPNGTLTMVFSGYHLPKTISPVGTVLGTNTSAPYTVAADDPTMYRNILVETLTTSTSPAVSTQTGLVASTDTPVVGQPVTYTATVAPVAPGTGTPTGTVTFTGDAGTLCTTPLNEATPDQATCTVPYGGAGNDSVTADYGGDTNYASSLSSPTAVTIDPDQTTTTLAVTPTGGVVGQGLTFVATVAADSPGAGTPTSTVAFSDSSGTLCTGTLDGLTPDEATCQISYAEAGTDNVTAGYSGDGNFAASRSASAAVTTSAASTTTAVATSDPSPVVGEPVTLTATVNPTAPGAGVPTGEVSFAGQDGALCTGTLDQAMPDQASCTTTYPATGSDLVTSTYGGDGNFDPSTSSSQTETIAAASTATAIAADPSDPEVGQSVTYTATVTATAPSTGTPTGTVTFSDGTTLCSGTLDGSATDQASCSTTYTSAQGESVTAAYQGDGNYQPSSSATLSQQVTPDVTTTALRADDAAPVVGQPVTFTASVAVTEPGRGTPTGTVTFAGDAGTLCATTLDASGTATCTTAYPSSGEDAVTASYEGDADDQGSESSAVSVDIGPDSTTTELTSSDATPVVGEPVRLTATVAPTAPGAGTPTGTVVFTGDAGTLCTAELDDSSTATCTTSYAASGTDTLTASYEGDANDTQSTSAPSSETISAAATTTSLSASSATSVVGEELTFSATVNTSAPGGGDAGGEVVFSFGGHTACTADLSGDSPDQASCPASFSSAGTEAVTARYLGTADYSPSVSNAVTESVGAASTSIAVASSVNPSVTGQAVTLTATVSTESPGAGVPTGKVVFAVETAPGQALTCTGGNDVSLRDGAATCAIGTKKLTPAESPLYVLAGFSGTANYQPSSTDLQQTVEIGSTTTTLKSTYPGAKPGSKFNLKVAVAPVGPAAGSVAGTVTISFSGGSALTCAGGDTLTLSGEMATCSVPAGELEKPTQVTATYNGSARFAASSATLQQAVS